MHLLDIEICKYYLKLKKEPSSFIFKTMVLSLRVLYKICIKQISAHIINKLFKERAEYF